jgi:hypothetical protein
MKRFDQTFNIAWVLLSIGICAKSVSLKLWVHAGPGSGLIPFISGLFIGIVGLSLLIRGWVNGYGAEVKTPYWSSLAAGRRVVFLLIGMCAMAYLMPKLGFFVTSLLVTSFMLYVIEPQSWWAVLATSLVSCITVYLLFGYLLEIRLPIGFLGI